jgi:hypothetical protein
MCDALSIHHYEVGRGTFLEKGKESRDLSKGKKTGNIGEEGWAFMVKQCDFLELRTGEKNSRCPETTGGSAIGDIQAQNRFHLG